MQSTDNNDEFMIDELSIVEEKETIISQWANEIVDFSDCYGSESSISYSAINICGRPSKYPAYGDFAECFSMRKYGPSNEIEFSAKDKHELLTFHDFIIIKYENYVFPRDIRVYETYHPGSIVRILAYFANLKKWKTLWQTLPAPVEKKAREFRPQINKFNSPTRILRIEFNHSFIDYYTGIDGVLLTGVKCKIPAKKPLTEQTKIKGIIQKKLETVQFKPQRTPSEAIEDFLKNDLSKFMENVGFEREEESFDLIDHYGSQREKKITDVPYEILCNVVSYLDLKSLYNCSQVCKYFRNLVFDPLLYTEINLKFYWHLSTSSFMESLTQRSHLIKKLDLSSCGYFDTIKPNDFIKFIQTNGKTLSHLRLNSSQFMNTTCIETISITCVNLIELSLRNYMNVTTERDFVSLAMLHNLEVLDLSRSGIDTIALLNIIKSNLNLKQLNIAFSSHHVSMDEVCIQISAFNKKMKSIDMWKCHNLTTIGVRALSECSDLEELDFGWCLRDEASVTESFKLLLQNCVNLKKLVLAAIRGISERDLENISTFCANLEHLDLMGIVGVSSEMCLKILQNCSNLKLLDISFCENIDDVNIIIWRNEFDTCIKRSEVPNDG
ncbi:CLUMA_CG010042, isoform A [Clunio marinus]|uniref:CLUMA_CG010042, isoform A n=1 Tax=Clunio marinus TaxID=568069 RepID=A0A1J1IBV8_9DIPT|nr:CLUMA_CG010042, isoform A [Clunio marinus]